MHFKKSFMSLEVVHLLITPTAVFSMGVAFVYQGRSSGKMLYQTINNISIIYRCVLLLLNKLDWCMPMMCVTFLCQIIICLLSFLYIAFTYMYVYMHTIICYYSLFFFFKVAYDKIIFVKKITTKRYICKKVERTNRLMAAVLLLYNMVEDW